MRKILLALFLSLFIAFTAAQDCKHARILGATWGTKDVTAKVAHSYNIGTKTFDASTSMLGDSNGNNKKTLTVVYEICQNVATIVVKEGEKITLP